MGLKEERMAWAMWNNRQRNRARRNAVSFPASLALMWDSSKWANSIVGTDLAWSYAGEQYVDGVSVGLNPPVTANGLGCYPARTNIFTTDGTSPEVAVLTAQDYCLQVFGSGSVTCIYGTATVGSPLQFTATSGSVTFTGTDIVDARWQLTADGGYVYPETPIGTSVTSSVGTASGNGPYIEMDEATIEAFGGKDANPATLTLATVATMGVGSDEIPTNTNILSPSDTVVSLFVNNTGKVAWYDGTGYSSVAITYVRNDRIIFVFQTDETGANFRVGYKNITQVDTEYTFSAWTVFDGSFDPLDYLRFALDSTVPIEIGHVQVHGEYVETSVVDKELGKYGWL